MANRVKKPTGRPKPISHSPGLNRNKRRYGCGGKLQKKSA